MRIRELFGRLRDRLRRDELDAELAEEMRHHRALLARHGESAARPFGNTTYHREDARSMWSLGIVDDLLHDLRYAARILRRDFGFTAAVVLTLAIGIGANTAVFGFVNAVLLQPLPYAHPEQLVSVWTAPAGAPTERNPTSLPELHDWQRQATVFSDVAAYAYNRFDINGPNGATQARAVQAAGPLYALLGAQPFLGRMPRADEEREPVVAISYRVWQEQFGGARTALGARVEMSGQPYTIIGVMAPGFHFPNAGVDLWTTLYSIINAAGGNTNTPWLMSRSFHAYRVVARMRSGVSITGAERAMNAIERGLATAYPDVDAGTEIHLQSVRDDSLGAVRASLWTVFGAAALILLLACANVAHLVLARLSARGRELAVRRALGAHRGRVVRQLVTESVLLGALGGAAGIGVALFATRALVRFAPADIPRLENVAVNGSTLAFAVVLALATGILFGVAPVLFGWDRGIHDTLRAQAKGAAGAQGNRTRATLTAAEVAFAVVLLVGAGLMLRTFARLTSADLGVRPSGAMITQLVMVGPRYTGDTAKIETLENVLSSIRNIPGVTFAGASTSMPPTRTQEVEDFSRSDKPRPAAGHSPSAIYIPATQGFWSALSIPIIRGRTFDARDGASAPLVVVVSRELVRTQFAGVDPIGQRIDVSGATRTIVGVVGDAVYEGVTTPIKPVIYVPYAQSPFPGVWIAMRTTLSEQALALGVRDAIHNADATIPIHRPGPMDAMIADAVVRPRFQAWLLSAFGGLALVLATIGIYGVIAYGVMRRQSEIGIRLALGAPRRAVVAMVVRSWMKPVMVGIVIGLAVALLGSGVLRSSLYGVPPTDAFTFVSVAVVLVCAALAAAYVPARRASRVDPLAAIRSD